MTNDDAVFDLQATMEQVGDDKDLLRELVDIYVGEYPAQLQSLEEAVGNNDAEAVRETAHSIKGAVGNFGAGLAVQAALNLENIGKSGYLSAAADALAALKLELDRLERELKDVVRP